MPLGGQRSNAGDQVQERVCAEANIGSRHADGAVEKPRQGIKPHTGFLGA
jgi:hypothetical protein